MGAILHVEASAPRTPSVHQRQGPAREVDRSCAAVARKRTNGEVWRAREERSLAAAEVLEIVLGLARLLVEMGDDVRYSTPV